MTDAPHDPPRTLPDDALPPVEPPSAGFIVQLFVIPAVIVLVIGLVWTLLYWLAHMGTDPKSYIEGLRRNTANRWQEAHNLATELNTTAGEALKKDPATARELADLLNAEYERADFGDESVKLRFYLCIALGEFTVPEVLPVLVKSAGPERDEREQSVRAAALQGLSRLIPKLDVGHLRTNDGLYDALLTASQDPNTVLRYHAAYTLGVLGGDRACERLKVLQDDADVDVRMNAALGLARNGDAACIPTLARMLDPADEDALATEKEAEAKTGKRITVQLNALEAAAQLHRANPSADLKPLTEAVERLIATDPPAAIRAKAEETKQALVP